MRTVPHLWIGSLVLITLSGCIQQPFGRLEGVLVEGQPEARPVEPEESGRVEITREGKGQQGRPNMALKKGDAVVTAADGIAIMLIADGYRVIMEPGTDLTISSIFLRVGRIIIKKIKEVKEALTVETELGTAAVEGTEFVVEVNRRQEVQLTVLEGRVKVHPRPGAQRQDTLTYVGGERGRLDSTGIVRLPPLSARATDSLRRRIRHFEITVRPEVPDVVGFTEAEARAKLERHGLVPSVIPVVTRQSRRVSRAERVEPFGRNPRVGTVVATSPAAGTRIRQGARVRLSVEAPSVMVPDVMGQPYAEAERVLNADGLQVGDTTYQVEPNAREGTVSGMQPGPGSYVRPGTAIALTITRMPVVERGDSVRIDRGRDRVPMCLVPSLMGLNEKDAIVSLKNAQLGVGQISRDPGRTVIDQDPKPGTHARCGSPVSFMIGTPEDVIR